MLAGSLATPQVLRRGRTASHTACPGFARSLYAGGRRLPVVRVNSSRFASFFLARPACSSTKPRSDKGVEPKPKEEDATSDTPSTLAGASENKLVDPTDLVLPSGIVGGVRNAGRVLLAQGANGEGIDPDLTAEGYLKRILLARVYDVAVQSPLQKCEKLSDRLGNSCFIKREDMQQVFSFKLRGAYNKMANLTREQLDRGVICSSAGNHAQGVALSAKLLGVDAVVVMPKMTPEIKWKSVERLGATVELVGENYDETQAYALKRMVEDQRTFVHPFDDPDVIAGQGTIGMEILRQMSGDIHAIFVPIGGGGLIAGVASYVKRLRPDIHVIGVEPAKANAMAQSLQRGERVSLSRVDGFADGVAVKNVGKETFRLCQELVDGVVLVETEQICAAIKDVFQDTRTILEPAGAVAIAGMQAYCQRQGITGKNMIAIASGANMNFDRLRVVSELADIGNMREAVFVSNIPEEKGSFRRFCQALGTDLNITEFSFRMTTTGHEAKILYSVALGEAMTKDDVLGRMQDGGFETFDLSKDELSMMHLRHMVAGRNTDVQNERIYRFDFPERPGALLKFLDAFCPRWNISLFHYRFAGERQGRVLVGLQILDHEIPEFNSLATALGYQHFDATSSEAYNLLCK